MKIVVFLDLLENMTRGLSNMLPLENKPQSTYILVPLVKWGQVHRGKPFLFIKCNGLDAAVIDADLFV